MTTSHQPSTTSSCISYIRKLSSSKYPVYLVPSSSDNKQIAVKSFPYSHPNYIKEKTILMSLQHPHIVTLYEAVDSGFITRGQRVSYVALEYAPYGDLLDIISTYGKIPEVLARTLFHNLIDAISYMHDKDIAHLDIKVDNLLIDENFDLKVTDFDLSQDSHSKELNSGGTPGYRAPEIKQGTCHNLKAADVYSAAIVLFIMLSSNPPYHEVSKGYQLEFDALYKAMRKQTKKFWAAHSRHRGDMNFYSREFKELFKKMVEEDPDTRLTIEEIRQSKWFNGPVLSKEDYKVEMKKYMKQDEEIL